MARFYRYQSGGHTLVGNNHEPGTVELKTYINDRYKITVYRAFDCGELYDLQEYPGEFINHWDDPEYATVKTRLLQALCSGRDGQRDFAHASRCLCLAAKLVPLPQ